MEIVDGIDTGIARETMNIGRGRRLTKEWENLLEERER